MFFLIIAQLSFYHLARWRNTIMLKCLMVNLVQSGEKTQPTRKQMLQWCIWRSRPIKSWQNVLYENLSRKSIAIKYGKNMDQKISQYHMQYRRTTTAISVSWRLWLFLPASVIQLEAW